nr:hypothetical protein [uncultured Sphaerochaeta sp.]
MSIIRRKRADSFALVPNSVANDDRLSFEERGLLVYLLAKPSDWQVNIADLKQRGGIGRDKAYKLLNGLIAAGYVQRERLVDPETGRVTGYNYTVSDVADLAEVPLPENQETDPDPLPGLPDPVNQDTYKEQKNTKTYSPLYPPTDQRPASKQSEREKTFELIWQVFPRQDGTSKRRCLSAFMRIDPADDARCLDAARRFAASWQRRPAHERGTPEDPTKWLPFLDNWIARGKWMRALSLPAPKPAAAPVDMRQYRALPRAHPLFLRCCAIEGKGGWAHEVSSVTFLAETVAKAEAEAETESSGQDTHAPSPGMGPFPAHSLRVREGPRDLQVL